MPFVQKRKLDINTNEVIYITSEKKDCHVVDFNSGNEVMTYKDITFAPKSLAFINEDFLIGAEKHKPLVYLSSHNNPNRKTIEFSMPGKVSVLILSHCCKFCFCAIGSLINVYMIITGDLICTIKYHNSPITCMKLNSHGSHLVSGAQDGILFVGDLPNLLGSTMINDDKFAQSWTHSTSISDVVISNTYPDVWIISCSIDKIIKIYDVISKQIIRVLLMNEPSTSILMDATHYHLYIGSIRGKIIKIYLSTLNKKEISYDEIPSSKRMCFPGGHRDKITCLSLSLMDNTLASGSMDNTCKLWSVETGYCLKTFHYKGPITNICIKIRPPSFDSAQLAVDFIPFPFKKIALESKTSALRVNLPTKRHDFTNSVLNTQEAEKTDRLELINNELQITRNKNEALIINRQLFTLTRNVLEEVSLNPEHVKMNLDDIKINPEDMKVDPEDRGMDPEDRGIDPEDRGMDPEDEDES